MSGLNSIIVRPSDLRWLPKHFKPVTIYALCDPASSEIRYVGATRRKLRARLLSHIKEQKKPGTGWNVPLKEWFGRLLAQGLTPEIVELETVSEETWEEAEQFCISYLRLVGAELLNITKGGKGSYGIKHSEETRKKIGVRSKERLRNGMSEAHRQAISASQKGKVVSEKTRALLRARFLGKPRFDLRGMKHSPEAIEKTAGAHRGSKRSAETRARIGAALKAWWVSHPEFGEVIAESNRRRAKKRGTS